MKQKNPPRVDGTGSTAEAVRQLNTSNGSPSPLPRQRRFVPPRFKHRLPVELSCHDRETTDLLRLASIRNARKGDSEAAGRFAELHAGLIRRRHGEGGRAR